MNTAHYFDGSMKHTFTTDISDLGLVDFPNDVMFGDQKIALYMKNGKTIICDIIDQDDDTTEPSITFKG